MPLLSTLIVMIAIIAALGVALGHAVRPAPKLVPIPVRVRDTQPRRRLR